jgi:insertion element IS1 protein InsB
MKDTNKQLVYLAWLITRYHTDYWGAYTRHLDPAEHTPGKRHTQQIERKHLTLRTRIKRLTRQTICFSRSIQMHDIVIGCLSIV